MEVPIGKKLCPKPKGCGEFLPLEDFARGSHTPDKRYTYCKMCINRRNRKKRLEGLEIVSERLKSKRITYDAERVFPEGWEEKIKQAQFNLNTESKKIKERYEDND